MQRAHRSSRRAKWRRKGKVFGQAFFINSVRYVHIIGLVGVNCVITFPTFLELVLAALSIFNLDILQELGIDCWLTKFDYIHTIISTIITPIAASLLFFFRFLTSSAIVEYWGIDTKKAKVERSNFYAYFLCCWCTTCSSKLRVLSYISWNATSLCFQEGRIRNVPV